MGLLATNIASGAIGAQVAAAAISANNVANANTPGFRAREARFASLPGGGVRVASTQASASFGSLIVTNNPLDVAIGGAGFLAFQGAVSAKGVEGTVLTRAGGLGVNADGLLVDPSGRALLPEIRIPEGTERIRISPQGDVVAQTGRDRAYVGTIKLATVRNPAGLQPLGQNALQTSRASGDVLFGQAGNAGFGRVIQGALESSNVNLASEAVRNVLSARAFSANVAVLRVADTILGETIGLVSDSIERERKGSKASLEISQAAGLSARVDESGSNRSSAELLSPSLRAQLGASRLDIPGVASSVAAERRHISERFANHADGNSGKLDPRAGRGQALEIAQRQAAQTRGVYNYEND